MAETVLIIGSSRGIGLELTLQFAEDGWNVHGTTRSGTLPDAFADTAHKPTIHKLEVRERDQINAMVEAIGRAPIDVLIVCAGVYDRVGGQASRGAPLPEDEVFAINTVAPMEIAEALFENLKAAERGRMIFVSSLEGSRTMRPPSTAYQRSKAALNDEVRAYAPVWHQNGVIGLAMHPGWVATDMGGANALVQPKDSAAGIRWIAGEMAPEHNGGFYNYRGEPLPW